MKYTIKTIFVLVVAFVAFGIFSPAYSATVSLSPVSSEIGIGEKMSVEIRVDSEGVSFNAAQATIRFPKDTLEVSSVDKTDSAFSFWLEEPKFSNTDGVISFTGGTPYGVSGGAVGILKIEFLAKTVGVGALSLEEAAITASDGSGTNILSKMNDAQIVVVGKRVTPKLPNAGEKLPEPVIIVRKAVTGAKLPAKPVLKIALYPEENRWYNVVSQFTASWDLPLDVSGVSTAINTQPNFTPPEKSEGLFESKTFPSLSDGTRYLHVRFMNNIGWGPVAHYKISLDTKAPLGFEVRVMEGEKTDNPAPTLSFETRDALSGLKEYRVRVGSSEPIVIPAVNFTGGFKMPIQAPGSKNVIVKAIDQAGNSIEKANDIEILPIESPVITFVPQELFPEDEQGLVVKGTALPGVNILLKVQKVAEKIKGEVVLESATIAESKGNWAFTFAHQPLRNGQYVVLAVSQDTRGAQSLEVSSGEIRVQSKPILQIGAFQLGMGGLALLLLAILIGGFFGGIRFIRKRKEKLSKRVEFVGSEVTKIFKLIEHDVEELGAAYQTETKVDDEYSLARLKASIKKMEQYLKKGVEKIKR